MNDVLRTCTKRRVVHAHLPRTEPKRQPAHERIATLTEALPSITASPRSFPASWDPCWACTSRPPHWRPGSGAALTCWKQGASPRTLWIRPANGGEGRGEVSSTSPCCVRRVCSVYLQVDDGRGAVTLHWIELQVSLEVLGVEPGDGQTVTESSLKEGRELWNKKNTWNVLNLQMTYWVTSFELTNSNTI